jgi:hypothetical protein
MRAFVFSLVLLAFGAATPPPPPGVLPDPKLTPGDVLPVTAADVCKPRYAKKVRNVPEAVKEAVYREYGIASHKQGSTEVDHLVSLELGGSNSIKNLWPEPFHVNVNGLDEGARVKDSLEDRLHQEVCSSRVTLLQAQMMIRGDWRPAYLHYFGHFPPFTSTHVSPQ